MSSSAQIAQQQQPNAINQDQQTSNSSDTSGPIGAVLAVVVFVGMLAWVISQICGCGLLKPQAKDGRVGWIYKWWCSTCAADTGTECTGRHRDDRSAEMQ